MEDFFIFTIWYQNISATLRFEGKPRFFSGPTVQWLCIDWASHDFPAENFDHRNRHWHIHYSHKSTMNFTPRGTKLNFMTLHDLYLLIGAMAAWVCIQYQIFDCIWYIYRILRFVIFGKDKDKKRQCQWQYSYSKGKTCCELFEV